MTSLAAPVLQHTCPAAGAHPAQEPMHPPAIPFLGLIGAFDRASVPEPIPATSDTHCITSSRALCALRYPQTGAIFPGRKLAGKSTKLHPSTNSGTRSTNSHKQATLSHTAPLPYFGIDRIGDFGQVGAASLWKSGPLFSTGTKEAELMLEGLRLNPRSPAPRSRGRRPGGRVFADRGAVDPSLSTGYASHARRRSTGPFDPIHRMWSRAKEGVV